MRHLFRCPMRWADLDVLGHVNNVVYVDYLQEARVDMLRVHNPGSRAEDLVEGVVVVRHEVDYLAPLTFRFAPVSIECWVTEVRAASFTMAYEIFDEDGAGHRTVYARARTVLTPYVFSTERPRRITADERGILEQFLEPAAPSRPSRDTSIPASAADYELAVRFSDVDVYGHVNNVKYFEYFQEARIPMLRQLFEGSQIRGLDGASVVAVTEVDYKVPIVFRAEPYAVRSWIRRVGNSSITVGAAIVDDTGEAPIVLALANVVMVFFDTTTQRSHPIPDQVRAAMVAAVADSGA